MDNEAVKKDVVFKGRVLTIAFAVRADGTMPAKDFYDSLDGEWKSKLMSSFRHMGEMGNFNHRERFKHVEGPIFEFKRFQIRMLCFRSESRWVLTNGCSKKGDKLDPSEIARAFAIMNDHIQREKAEKAKAAKGRHPK